MQKRKRKEKATPFGVNSMRTQILYRVAHALGTAFYIDDDLQTSSSLGAHLWSAFGTACTQMLNKHRRDTMHVLQVRVWHCQMLLGRLGQWGKAFGGEGQCDALHYSQRSSWLGMEHQTRQIH